MDCNGNNDKSKSFPFINEIPSLQRFSRDDFKCSLPISSNLKKVFNDMEKEEDECSESSSFQEFQFFMKCDCFCSITVHKPSWLSVHPMNLKEIDERHALLGTVRKK